jgi:hypothetical protein
MVVGCPHNGVGGFFAALRPSNDVLPRTKHTPHQFLVLAAKIWKSLANFLNAAFLKILVVKWVFDRPDKIPLALKELFNLLVMVKFGFFIRVCFAGATPD